MSRQTTEPLRRLRWTGSGRTKARGKRGVNLGSIGQRASELRCSAPGRTRTCGLAIRSSHPVSGVLTCVDADRGGAESVKSLAVETIYEQATGSAVNPQLGGDPVDKGHGVRTEQGSLAQ
jgi:hypothetical protein